MDNVIKMHWLLATFLSILAMIPAWIAPNFFKKNFGIELVPFMFWYYTALCVALLVFQKVSHKNDLLDSLIPSPGPILAIFIFGLTIGFIGNITTFVAVTEAPNPGLPNAIKNLQTVGLLFVSMWLGNMFPKYFTEGKVDSIQIVGVFLTVAGTALIVLRR